jgi:hypothetical protein
MRNKQYKSLAEFFVRICPTKEQSGGMGNYGGANTCNYFLYKK